MAVPDIGPLISLVGSVGFSVLGLIIPVFMETVWYWYPTEDDDGPGQDGWDGVPPVNGVGVATVVAVAGGVTANDTDQKKNTKSGRRVFGRTVRHIKNIILLILASFALVGGAIYNILDIIALSNGTLSPMM